MTDTTMVRSTEVVERWLEELADEPEATPIETARPPLAALVVRRGLLIFSGAVVAFLVFSFLLSGFAHARSQVGLQRRFRSELASLSVPIGGTIAPGSPVAIVRIPRIGVNEVVVEGGRSGQLRAGPGHVVGSPLPGQPGNAVIAARRLLYGGPFRQLGSLERGDRVELTTGQGKSVYRVTGVARVVATDGSVLANFGDNRLTLFTSDPLLRASRRLVATASLIGRPYAPTGLARNLEPDGLGLTGERGAIASVLVWLELLAALSLLTVYAMTRRSRWSVWVVFMPALALVVWLFFENAVRLLPATL